VTETLVRPVGLPTEQPDSSPNRPARRGWWRGLSVLILLIVVLAPAGGLLHQAGQGQLMEDGFMILLPQRVLHGAVAYRDFDWLWGPAGLWLPALVHAVFGWTETVSRLIGLAYAVGTTLAAYALVRRWSEGLGVLAGVIMALIDRASDLPEYAAIGLSLLALYFAYRSLIGRGARLHRYALLSGLTAGAVLLFRPDRGVGVALALLIVFWSDRSRRQLAGIGLLAGGALLGAYAAVAGFGVTFENLVVTAWRIPGDRYLPFPVSNYRDDLWMALVVVALGIDFYAGWRRRRISPASPRGPVMLGAAFLALTLIPEFLQRADAGHLLVAGSLAVALLPAALSDLVQTAEETRIPAGTALRYGAGVLAVLSVGAYQEAVAPYLSETGTTLTVVSPDTTTVVNQGHSFVYPTGDALLMAQLVLWVQSNTRPGQTLFIGPGDLSRTPYNDNSVAVLLPTLRDAMHFPDMNPTVAVSHEAVLARDVASADVVILDRQIDQWNEANGSSQFGSQAANRVVSRQFCPAAEFGLYEVLLRCSAAG